MDGTQEDAVPAAANPVHQRPSAVSRVSNDPRSHLGASVVAIMPPVKRPSSPPCRKSGPAVLCDGLQGILVFAFQAFIDPQIPHYGRNVVAGLPIRDAFDPEHRVA